MPNVDFCEFPDLYAVIPAKAGIQRVAAKRGFVRIRIGGISLSPFFRFSP